MKIWFDRHLDFRHGSLIDATLGNLPRLIASRSIDKQRRDSRLASKQSVKLGSVERAINNIGRDIKAITSSTKLQLNKFPQIHD